MPCVAYLLTVSATQHDVAPSLAVPRPSLSALLGSEGVPRFVACLCVRRACHYEVHPCTPERKRSALPGLSCLSMNDGH